MKQEFLDACINTVLSASSEKLKGCLNPLQDVYKNAYPEAIKDAILCAFKANKLEELRPMLETIREAMAMLDGESGAIVFNDDLMTDINIDINRDKANGLNSVIIYKKNLDVRASGSANPVPYNDNFSDEANYHISEKSMAIYYLAERLVQKEEEIESLKKELMIAHQKIAQEKELSILSEIIR